MKQITILNSFGMPTNLTILDTITNSQGEKYLVRFENTPKRTYKIRVNKIEKAKKAYELDETR